MGELPLWIEWSRELGWLGIGCFTALGAALGWRRRWPTVGALGGATAALALLGALALLTEDARRPDQGLIEVRVEYEPGNSWPRGYVRPPLDTAPVAFLLGMMSPFHREDSLRNLSSRYSRVAPSDERTTREAIRMAELQTCEAGMAERLYRGRYEDILRAEPSCAAARREQLRAALAIGDLERAAALLPEDRSSLLPAEHAEIYVALERWNEAAQALGDVRGENAACLRRSIERRAGHDVEPLPSESSDFCRAAWADALPPGERGAILRDVPPSTAPAYLVHPGRLLQLLALENGVAVEGHPYVPDVFAQWRSGRDLPYSGLHAAARRAWDRAGQRSPRTGRWLYASAAVFEATTGDPERAARFAEVALAISGSAGLPEEQAAPLSVVIFAALERGDVEGARRTLGRMELDGSRDTLASWIALLGERTYDEGTRIMVQPSPAYARAAAAGDGEGLALILSLRPYDRAREAALVAPLIERGRDSFADVVRWGAHESDAIGLRPRTRALYWAGERRLALAVGDEARARLAQRRLDRFRAILMRRETAVPLLLLEHL